MGQEHRTTCKRKHTVEDALNHFVSDASLPISNGGGTLSVERHDYVNQRQSLSYIMIYPIPVTADDDG